MGFLQRIFVGLMLAAVSLGAVSVAVWLVVDAIVTTMNAERQVRPPREIVRTVNVVTFTAGDAMPVLNTYGEVLSRRTLEIRATASGTVIALAPEFQEGGRVRAGQVLVQIDPATPQADLAVAQADLAEAAADQRDAERSLALAYEDQAAAEEQAALRAQALERQEGLASRGVGTSAAVEEAALTASSARQAVVSRRQAVASAEARIDQTATRLTRAEIAVAEARRRLDETEIRARFAGTLGDVSLVEGGLVSTNDILANLVDPTALEVAFRISTAQHARLLDTEGQLIGLPVEAVLDVAGLELIATGVINRESATVGEGQTGRQVFARLDNATGFRPGDFVTVRVAEPPLSNVAQLPAAALGPDGTVLVLGPEDRLQAAPVVLERRQGEFVLVRGDLDGRQVVAERTPLLGAGLKVRPVDPAPSGTAPEPPAMLTLAPERRARLVAFVEGNARMPSDVKTRLLGQLGQDQVPAQMIERLESRMGS